MLTVSISLSPFSHSPNVAAFSNHECDANDGYCIAVFCDLAVRFVLCPSRRAETIQWCLRMPMFTLNILAGSFSLTPSTDSLARSPASDALPLRLQFSADASTRKTNVYFYFERSFFFFFVSFRTLAAASCVRWHAIAVRSSVIRWHSGCFEV